MFVNLLLSQQSRTIKLNIIYRIALVMFSVEFALMLILPRVVGDGGMETWFSTLGDAFILAVIATPLTVKWSLKGSPLEKQFIANDAFYRFSVLNVGIAIFSVVFSIECGIMLLAPMAGLDDGSLALAGFDAGLLSIIASPIVLFILAMDQQQIYSFSNTDKIRNVQRQFLMLFLPQLVLFLLVTESVYLQETRTKEKFAAIEDAQRLEFVKDDLSLRVETVVDNLLALARRSSRYLSVMGLENSERMLLGDVSDLLETEGRFSSGFFVDSQGKTRLHVSLQDGRAVKTTQEIIINSSLKMLNQTPAHVNGGDIFITGPQMAPTFGQQEVSVLRFGTHVVDDHGNMLGMVFLDCLWDDFVTLLNKKASSMFGRLQLNFDSKRPLYSFPMDAEALSIDDGLWKTINNSEKGRAVDKGGVVMFTTLHYGLHPVTRLPLNIIFSTSGVDHQPTIAAWKMLSWISVDRLGFQSKFFRKNLLIFQALLISLAAIGSWLFSHAIVNRREADARNERAYQSRITLSALLETALVPMSMEEQLRSAIQIVSTTPWVGLTGKGAVFITEHESKHMKLAAHNKLSDEELNQAKIVSTSRCLCHKLHNPRKIFCLPTDVPEHVLCLKSEMGQGSYCIPIPGVREPIGVMYMQLMKGHASRDEEAFLSTAACTISGIIERRNMEIELHKKNDELRKTRLDIIHRLGMAAEYRDQETGLHVVRMSKYAALLARAAGHPEEFCEIMINAAPMHDVGKIGIPDHILLKPARLTSDEWNIMKQHTLIGSMMLHGYDAEPMNTAHIIALTHHERWDGKGYPIGVPGEEIPIEGRICAIADVFDALTSDRPYKKAWSPEDSLREIRNGSGSAFDPHLVSIFVDIFPDILAIRNANSDE